jgi:hypothetical protein
MTEKKFRIIYNLDGLTDAQIAEYARDVSIYFDLDPAVNWFDVLWMVDPDTGLRRRQLYARRGTTDVMRDKRGISITEMTFHTGPGFVAYTAKGVDKNGRQEMAVGAHSIEGLQGEKLAAAVATAETRAGRRLTLKFCGLGILDYSEVSDPVELKINVPNLELANPTPVVFLPPPPVVASTSAAPVVPAAADAVAVAKAEADEIGRLALEQLKLAAQTKPVEPSVQEAVPASPEPPTKKRRSSGPRKSKNTVSLSDAPQPAPTGEAGAVLTQVNSAVPTQVFDAGGPPNVAPQANPAAPSQAFPVTPPPPVPASGTAVPNSVTDFPGKPNAQQQEEYRNKLRDWSNNVLPIEGGMVPSAGIGGPSAKLRSFCVNYVGKSTQEMTADDWEEFLTFLVNFKDKNGAKGLVKYINDSLNCS